MGSNVEINNLASNQGGVIARHQILAMGFSDGKIRRRVQSGEWSRVSSGVYRIYPARDEIDVLRAAVAILPDPVVSHRSAAAIHKLSTPPGVPTVSVHSQTTHVFPGVVVVRCHDLTPSHRLLHKGLPVTTIARTLVDLGSELSRGLLARTVDDAVARRKVTPLEIRSVLDDVARQGKPGVTATRWVLSRLIETSIPPSVLEARFRRLLEENEINGFRIEYPIPWDPRRRFDLAFPEHLLAIELDSRRWHARVDAFDRDRSRDRETVLHGWRILRFTWTDVENEPQAAIAAVPGALSP
jgi:very-short-patch-repair endonuclease